MGPGESTVGVLYLSMRIHPKCSHIFPVKIAAASPDGSRKGAVRA